MRTLIAAILVTCSMKAAAAEFTIACPDRLPASALHLTGQPKGWQGSINAPYSCTTPSPPTAHRKISDA